MSGETSAGEIRAALAASRARLLATISGVTEEQFKRRPPDGGWCIAEALAHLLASEKGQAERIRLALIEDGAEAAMEDREGREAQARAGRVAPVPQLIHGLLAARREVDRLLEQAETAGGLERAVVHATEGRRTVSWMLLERVAAHEQEHVAQIEALKASVAGSQQEPRSVDSV
jgi:hypothetical protein